MGEPLSFNNFLIDVNNINPTLEQNSKKWTGVLIVPCRDYKKAVFFFSSLKRSTAGAFAVRFRVLGPKENGRQLCLM